MRWTMMRSVRRSNLDAGITAMLLPFSQVPRKSPLPEGWHARRSRTGRGVLHPLTATWVLVQALRHPPSPRHSQIDYIWEPPVSRGDFRVGDAAAWRQRRDQAPRSSGQALSRRGTGCGLWETPVSIKANVFVGAGHALPSSTKAKRTKHQVPSPHSPQRSSPSVRLSRSARR
jgi:hypothetical protein